MCFEFDKPTENAINAICDMVLFPSLITLTLSLLMYIAFGEKPNHTDKCQPSASTTTVNTTK